MTALPTSLRRPRRRRLTAPLIALAALFASFVVISPTAPADAGGGLPDDDWLGIVNTYRAMSGVAPVTESSAWSSQAQAHSCYMLLNGISHDEYPGSPGYTSGGDIAGNSGNVAVSSSLNAKARHHIDLWMTGPFHAIGILRHNLTQSGFGLCLNSNPPTPWHSGGTMDVIRGLDYSRPRPAEPILFPGEGSTVSLNRFITEYPNPMTMCGWTGDAGLPLIAMMPNNVSSANSTITGPNGPVSTCTLHAGNSGSNGTAQSILAGENAVVVMPRDILANGEYTVTVNTNSGSVTWSFAVDTNAPLQYTPPEPPPVVDTEPNGANSTFVPVEPFRLVNSRKGIGPDRLQAGETVRIETGEQDAEAISANFVAAWPSASGHLRLFNCTDEVPTVSTVNYVPGVNRANQAIVPVDGGDFCVYSSAEVDLIVDVNGFYYGSSDASAFTPASPERLYNSRDVANGRLRAGVERRVKVIGAPDGPPANASAAALNVTAVDAPASGYLQVYPCGADRSLETSTINYGAAEARANTVVVGADADGYVCLRSLRDVDVLIDYAGYFADDSGSQFTPLDPIRLFDSRQFSGPLNESTYGGRVGGGEVLRLQIAGERGVPADAKAVSINLTATQAISNLYVTAYPCGARPGVSNLNTKPGATTANGAMVKLSGSGELCLYARRDVHLLVDINGVWR